MSPSTLTLVVAAVAAWLGFAGFATAVHAADGEFIILRQVSPRTAYRLEEPQGPVLTRVQPGQDAKNATLDKDRNFGGFVARELGDAESASIVSRPNGVADGSQNGGLGSAGGVTREGATTGRAAHQATSSAIRSTLGGTVTGGRSGGGAVGDATSDVGRSITRMVVPIR